MKRAISFSLSAETLQAIKDYQQEYGLKSLTAAAEGIIREWAKSDLERKTSGAYAEQGEKND